MKRKLPSILEQNIVYPVKATWLTIWLLEQIEIRLCCIKTHRDTHTNTQPYAIGSVTYKLKYLLAFWCYFIYQTIWKTCSNRNLISFCQKYRQTFLDIVHCVSRKMFNLRIFSMCSIKEKKMGLNLFILNIQFFFLNPTWFHWFAGK